METEAKRNAAILKITAIIQTEFSELVKYLNEMPVTIPDVNNPKISNVILEEYYNTIVSFLRKYKPNHITNI